MAKKHLLAVLLLASAALSGCIFQGGNGTEPEDGNAEQETFFLSFRFEEGSAVFQRMKLTFESEGSVLGEQGLDTVSLVKSSTAEFSELQLIVTEAYASDENGTKSICKDISLEDKRRTVKFYPDGRVDFGVYSATTFHLPQRELKIGETWDFEGIEYKIEEKTVFENSAGRFE